MAPLERAGFVGLTTDLPGATDEIRELAI